MIRMRRCAISSFEGSAFYYTPCRFLGLGGFSEFLGDVLMRDYFILMGRFSPFGREMVAVTRFGRRVAKSYAGRGPSPPPVLESISSIENSPSFAMTSICGASLILKRLCGHPY